jgi:bacterioferritin-associated ferredoxin
MYVCVCNAVTEREIRSAVDLGVTSMRQLKRDLGVASNCGKCASCACDILRDELSNKSAACGAFAFAPAA